MSYCPVCGGIIDADTDYLLKKGVLAKPSYVTM